MNKLSLLAIVLTLVSTFTHAQNPIVNGTFATGSPLGFATDYPENCTTTTSPRQRCVDLTGWDGVSDHSTPSDNLMLVDGRSSNLDPNLVLGQVVNVNPYTAYTFSFWVDPRNFGGNEVDLDVFVDGVLQGNFFTTNNAGWQDDQTNFTTGAASTVNLEIRQANWGPATDFNIDDLELIGPTGQGCSVVSQFTQSQVPNTCEWNFTATSFVQSANTQVVDFVWNFDGVIMTGANPTVRFAQSGTYNVCLTTYAVNDKGECCSSTRCTEIVVECPTTGCEATANFGFESDGNCTYWFQNSASSTGTILGYVWDFGDGNTSNDPNPNHVYSSSGTFNVCLTVIAIGENGTCCTDVICQEVTVNCESARMVTGPGNATTSGIGLDAMSVMELYPNPTNGLLNIEMNDVVKAGTGSILVLDNTGRLVHELTTSVQVVEGDNRFSIDTESLPAGLYLINIELNGNMTSQRFVKE